MNEDSEKVDTRLLPRLTKTNWTTEYKNAAQCLALNYGEAGDIILTGVNSTLQRPNRADQELNNAGVVVDKYPDTDRGD